MDINDSNTLVTGGFSFSKVEVTLVGAKFTYRICNTFDDFGKNNYIIDILMMMKRWWMIVDKSTFVNGGFSKVEVTLVGTGMLVEFT